MIIVVANDTDVVIMLSIKVVSVLVADIGYWLIIKFYFYFIRDLFANYSKIKLKNNMLKNTQSGNIISKKIA